MDNGTVIRVEIITLTVLRATLMNACYRDLAPAYETALSDIKRHYPRLNVTQHIISDEGKYSMCNDFALETDDYLGRYYFSNLKKWEEADLTVFIAGHSDCDGRTIGVFGSALRKLTMTMILGYPSFQDKIKWPTWVITGHNSQDTTLTSWLNLVWMNNWTTIAIICDLQGRTNYCPVAEVIRKRLRSSVKGSVYRIDGSQPDVNYKQILTQMNLEARVYFVFGYSTATRQIMLAAHSLNMTRGEHVFITMAYAGRNLANNYTWDFGDNNNQVAKEAYRALFVMEPDFGDLVVPGTVMNRLGEQWRASSKEQFNYTYRDTPVTPTSAYISMMTMAEVVSELARTNRTDILRDGVALTKQFLDRWFDLRVGRVYISAYGERIVDYTCSQHQENGTIQKIWVRNPRTLTFSLVNNVSWMAPVWPVPNRPRCGYDAEDLICRPENTDVVAGVSSSVVLVFLVLFSVGVSIWHTRRERDMATWWILEPERLAARKSAKEFYHSWLSEENVKVSSQTVSGGGENWMSNWVKAKPGSQLHV